MWRLSTRPRWWTRIRALGRRSPERPLFLLATHRTGSTLLRTALDTLAGVSLAGEVLNHNNKPGVAEMDRSELLAHLDRSLRAERADVVGAKIMLTHLRPDVLPVAVFVEAYSDARYVLLYRRDLLAQWLSMQRAAESGAWTDAGGTASTVLTAPAGPMRVAPSRVCKFAERQRRRYDAAREALRSADVMQLTYEELDADLEAAVGAVQERFDLRGRFDPDGIPLRRQRMGDPHDLVENWDEVGPIVESGDLTLDLGAAR